MADNKMIIKKVKVISDGSRKCIKVEYSLNREETADELTGLYREEAAPEFYAAFEALKEHVEEILEIYDKHLGDRIEPYGVTFHYSKDGTMGAIISSKFILPDAGTSIVLNTPMRKCMPGEDIEGAFLTEKAANALWDVEQETRKYIAGKRAQVSLFGDNGEIAPDEYTRADGEEESEDYEEDEGEPENQGAAEGRGAVVVDISKVQPVTAVS